MRLLFVVTSMDVGGIETNLVRLSRALISRGHEVAVVSSGGPLVSDLEQAGAEHLTSPVIWQNPLGLARTILLLRHIASSYDIVHTMSAAANIVTAIARGQSGEWPIVSSPMGLQNSDREPEVWTRLRNRLLTWRADRILTISPAIEHELQAIGVRSERMRAVALVGLDDSALQVDKAGGRRARAELGVRGNERLVVTIGALHRRKSHELFLEAAKWLADREPGIRYAIVGKGPEEGALRSLARRLGIADTVTFTGELRDVRDLLAASDVYVRPGIVEGFIGITVLEAMAARRPVVAFETRDVRVAIEDGKTGLLAARGDPVDLGRRILQLLHDRHLARRIADEGNRLVLEQFRIDVAAASLESVYEDVRRDAVPS